MSNNQIVLEDTQTTQKTDSKERALASIFKKIATLIINDKDYPNLAALKDDYDKLYVRPVIERAVYDIYLIGVDYVNLFLRTQGTIKMSKDGPRIEDIANEMDSSFWTKIRVYTDREILIKSAIENKVKKIPKRLDLKYMMEVTATTLATWTLKTATVSKLLDMRDQIDKLDYRLVKNEVKASVAIKGMGRAILDDINAVNRKDIKEGKKRKLTTKDIYFIWEARLDEFTCLKLPNGSKGCRYIHGTRWKFDDAENVPTPGGTGRNPTHYNCRCRIIIQIGNDGFYA